MGWRGELWGWKIAVRVWLALNSSPPLFDTILQAFLQPELLDANDKWYCGKCKQHVQAEKKLDLWSLPDVLVIFLKRFSYSR